MRNSHEHTCIFSYLREHSHTQMIRRISKRPLFCREGVPKTYIRFRLHSLALKYIHILIYTYMNRYIFIYMYICISLRWYVSWWRTSRIYNTEIHKQRTIITLHMNRWKEWLENSYSIQTDEWRQSNKKKLSRCYNIERRGKNYGRLLHSKIYTQLHAATFTFTQTNTHTHVLFILFVFFFHPKLLIELNGKKNSILIFNMNCKLLFSKSMRKKYPNPNYLYFSQKIELTESWFSLLFTPLCFFLLFLLFNFFFLFNLFWLRRYMSFQLYFNCFYFSFETCQ